MGRGCKCLFIADMRKRFETSVQIHRIAIPTDLIVIIFHYDVWNGVSDAWKFSSRSFDARNEKIKKIVNTLYFIISYASFYELKAGKKPRTNRYFNRLHLNVYWINLPWHLRRLYKLFTKLKIIELEWSRYINCPLYFIMNNPINNYLSLFMIF